MSRHKIFVQECLTGELPDYCTDFEQALSGRWCFKGGGGASVPPASEEEKALAATVNEILNEQLDIVRDMSEKELVIGEFLLREAGYAPILSEPNEKDAARAKEIEQEIATLKGGGSLSTTEKEDIRKQISELELNEPDPGVNQAEISALKDRLRNKSLSRADEDRIKALEEELQGLDPTGGRFIGIEELPLSPEEQERVDRDQTIQDLFSERTLAALKGELPVNPALERDITRNRNQVTETLRRQLGPGFETSSAGIETLSQLFAQEEAVREGARRGDLTIAEQLRLGSNEFSFNRGQENLNQLLLGSSLPYQGVQAFNTPAAGFNNRLNQLAQNRYAIANANAANAAASASSMAGLFGGLGTIGGAVLAKGLPSGFLSDRRLKTDIRRVGSTDDGLPVYVYRYLGDSTFRMGVMADEVELVRPEAVQEQNGFRAVDYALIN